MAMLQFNFSSSSGSWGEKVHLKGAKDGTGEFILFQIVADLKITLWEWPSLKKF